jgi:hypothetical protein
MLKLKLRLLFVYFLFNFSLYANKGERIFIQDATKPQSEKEVILILPGFGSKIQGTERIAAYFFNKGYDVYIPDYISRKSIANCVDNLDQFMLKYKLKDYKKMHVFSYIIGSWTLNNWLIKTPANNIVTIVYDRSPLQERAPYALVKDIPLLIRIISGKVMKEFSKTPYPSLTNDKISKGILIESKATKLITKHKKTALSLGPVIWEASSLNQSCSDKCYLLLNHDQMYYRFDISGVEIFNFIKLHQFTDSARREPYTEDPFINNLDK